MNMIKAIRNNQFVDCSNAYDNEYFYSIDSKERFIESCKKEPHDWIYRNRKIKYTVNSEGYRTDEFDHIDWKNSIVMFGCSHVFGTGNDDADTIPNLLEHYCGIPVINMGINGASNMMMLHNSLMLSRKYPTPKKIIYMWTSLIRNSIYGYNHMSSYTFGYSKGTDYEVIKKVFNRYHEELDQPDHIVDHTLTSNFLYINLIREIWNQRCPIYECSMFENTAKSLQCDYYSGYTDDYARDCIHVGFKSNHKIAKEISQKL